MRLAVMATAMILIGAVSTPAYADYPTHVRHVEWQLVEPCNMELASGEVVLEWGDFSGAYEEITVESPDYSQPIRILIYAGCPDYAGLDWQFYFCGCGWDDWRPEIYCGNCNPCNWYKYAIKDAYCCDTVCVRACLPGCVVLEITDVW